MIDGYVFATTLIVLLPIVALYTIKFGTYGYYRGKYLAEMDNSRNLREK